MESFEKNRHTLKSALRQLPTYTPPQKLWDGIQDGLASPEDAQEEELHTAIKRMPAYTPPAKVWNNLAKKLDHTQKVQGKRVQMRKWLSLAASLALVITAGIWLLSEKPPTVKFTYSQETVSQFHYDLKLEEDEATFAALEAQLVQQNDPTLNKLHLELSELNDARNEVKTILQSYGQDPQLVNQLSDIERVRSDIYRQIIEIML